MYNRSERCLLPCTHLSAVPKVSQICDSLSNGRNLQVPIQGLTIRGLISPKDFLKNFNRSNSPSENEKRQDHSISGRPANNWDYERRVDLTQGSNYFNPATTGMDHQLGKVQSYSQQSNCLLGYTTKFQSPDVLPTRGKKEPYDSKDAVISATSVLHNKRGYESVGASDRLHRSSPMVPESYKDLSELDSVILGQRSLAPRSKDPTTSIHKVIPSVVDRRRSSEKGSSLVSLANKGHSDGCESVRMGGISGRRVSSRAMVLDDSEAILKPSRVEGGLGSSKGSFSISERLPYQSLLRQCDDGSLSPPSRGHQESRPVTAIKKNFHLGREQHFVPNSYTFKRESEWDSRLPESEVDRPSRMVSKPRNLWPDNTEMGSSSVRPLRYQGKCQNRSFLLAAKRCLDLSERCIQSQVGRTLNVCLPSNAVDIQDDTKNYHGQSKSNCDSSFLAQEELVCNTKSISNSRPNITPISEGPSSSGTHIPSRPAKPEAFGLDPEWGLLRSKGLSDSVISTLKASRKPITFAIYSKIWKKFVTFCGTATPNQLSPNISQVLDFLQAGFEKGLKTNTLKVQISALGAFFDIPLADHRWIKRFIRATSRLRPQLKQRVPTWDLSLVLNYLTGPPFEPLESASIKDLTLKVTFLVAITSARRLGEIQALSIREPYLKISSDRVTLTLDKTFIPKVSSDFHRNQEIILPSFCQEPKNPKEMAWHSLDVKRALLQYLKQTESWRQDHNILLQYGGRNKGRKASKASIARWIQSVIRAAYTTQRLETPGKVKAHSTRAMAASWAEKRGASIEEICRAATWSSHMTFAKHYRLDLHCARELAFGRKVLQAVVPP
ncbi:uncharacterized protein [Engystomops pustulosus]|uniref:uncharacterized protein isoform X1 n=1 Tax=Engystomops pustulosus TaxID=76066 RepID=UPI003AFACE2E